MTGRPDAAGRTKLEDDALVSWASAAVGSLTFLVLAPGIVAGLIPWLITGWSAHEWWMPLRALGAALIAGGLLILLHAFARFVIDGVGTPAPTAPTERLVIGGPYRYVRNPMYLAVTALIVGQALLLGSAALVVYAAGIAAAFTTFVRAYEQPTLMRRYGDEYRAYCQAVPAWRPRRRPWRGDSASGSG
jgi:protein-S-isoprenylcysteine O-methyltransferase Ste14